MDFFGVHHTWSGAYSLLFDKALGYMKFTGLKTSIAADFALLLSVGMLLVNFVVISLWQQYMVGYEVDRAQSRVQLLINYVINNCERLPQSSSFINKADLEHHVEHFFFINNTIVGGSSLSDNGKKMVELAAHSQTELVKTYGSIFSFLGLSAKDILVARPIKGCGGKGAVGALIHMQGVHDHIMAQQSSILVYILVNTIILTTVGFFRLRRSVVKPLEKLVRLSESYQDGDAFLSLGSSQSEFGHVAKSLHAMLARTERDRKKLNETIASLEEANKQILENQKTLVEAEKFAAVGKLSAGLAHEIGNPLGIIQGYIELLSLDDISSVERKQYAQRADKELDRVIQLIRQLLNFARKERVKEPRSEVNSLIQEVVKMLSQQRSSAHIQFNVYHDDRSYIAACHGADLHQVLLNCLLNAVDAINEKNITNGEVTITVGEKSVKDLDCIKIQIDDNGCGIASADLSAVFDPFFTTKQVGYGTGLGLSVSRSLIESCGGVLEITSDKNGGSCVTIVVPTAKG